MSSFSERLSAAKSAERPHKDVQILLDEGLAVKREALQSEVDAARLAAAADPRLTGENPGLVKVQKKLDALLKSSADALTTLRFTRLPGSEWADITARCPVRLDAPLDRQYGYNMQAATMLAAPRCGVLVEGDDEIPLTVTDATDDAPAVDEWADLFTTISGHEFIRIMDAIYEMNEYAPAERINSLKKALATRPA